jgi:hypothetical protein
MKGVVMTMILAENNGHKLMYDASKVNCYIVYHIVPVSPSNELKLAQMVAQSSMLSKKIKSYFTHVQIQTAIVKMHAARYVS